MAVAVCVIAIAGEYTAKPLLAQIRAALVQNVDEPGRTPYQSTLVFKQGTGGCGITACTLIFGSVPNGKRLVATNLMGTVFVDTPGIILPLKFSGLTGVPTLLQAGVFPGPVGNENVFAVNAEIHAVFDSGPIAPQMNIVATTPISLDTTGETSGIMTLSGYLLDCSVASACAAIVH